MLLPVMPKEQYKTNDFTWANADTGGLAVLTLITIIIGTMLTIMVTSIITM